MTMIVGFAPDGQGRAVLHLAGLLARSAGDDLVIACVVPAPWSPGMARIDAEYREYLDGAADEALAVARANAPDGVVLSYARHGARSVPAGLLELAEGHHARLIVLGSSSSGPFGHVSLGSVTDRLLHSSPIALALANRGFRCRPDLQVTRATVAYGGSSSESLVVAAAGVAADVGVPLRIASFAVWTRPAYTSTLGTDSEDLVLQEWTAQLQEAVAAALMRIGELEEAPPAIDTVIGRGASWGEALDDVSWDEGDVMVVGSSSLGPMARVFLGSRATKILRSSPVPLIVVPREQTEQMAERAET
jgi:nucleotide-binding universal stress UspA family protein